MLASIIAQLFDRLFRENPSAFAKTTADKPGGGAFDRGLRWLALYSPLRGWSFQTGNGPRRLGHSQNPPPQNPFQFSDGLQGMQEGGGVRGSRRLPLPNWGRSQGLAALAPPELGAESGARRRSPLPNWGRSQGLAGARPSRIGGGVRGSRRSPLPNWGRSQGLAALAPPELGRSSARGARPSRIGGGSQGLAGARPSRIGGGVRDSQALAPPELGAGVGSRRSPLPNYSEFRGRARLRRWFRCFHNLEPADGDA